MYRASLAIVLAEFMLVIMYDFEPWEDIYVYTYCSLLATGYIWCLTGRLNHIKTKSKTRSFQHESTHETPRPADNAPLETAE